MISPAKFLLLSLLLCILNATVTFITPKKTTFPDNKLNYSYANFGVVHYGKKQNFVLVFLNESLCNTTKTKHFTKPTYVAIQANLSQCSYTVRAITAQNLGAKGIIFGSPDTKYYDQGVVLADDGNGRKVHITSLFVSPEDMQGIKALKNPQIKVNFDVVKRKKSNVVMFMSSSNRDSYVFLREFREYYEKLQDHISMKLIYHTFKCEYCSKDECSFEGNFCQYDTQNWYSGMGSKIISEQLQQYKLYQNALKDNAVDKWFDYMNQFDEKCIFGWNNSADCSSSLVSSLGLNDAGGIDSNRTMTEWKREQIASGVNSFPDMTVNGIRHMENLTPTSVFQMICSSLVNPPSDCDPKHTSSSSKTGLVFGLVISSIVLFLLGLYCYKLAVKRQITNDMSSRVSEMVAKYATKVSEQNKKRKEKMLEKMTEQI